MYRNGEDFEMPLHQFNPGFLDGPAQTETYMPPEGTQYRLAGYLHPDAPRQPMTPLQAGGSYRIHNYSGGEASDGTMENLLKNLPSRQLEMIATNAARTLHHRTTRRKSFVNEVTNIGPGVSVDDYKISAVDFETTTTDTESWDVICSSAVRMSTKKELVSTKLKALRKKFGSHKKTKVPGHWKSLKYGLGMMWVHFKYRVEELEYVFELWRQPLKQIEGHFGAGVLSYFLFLKWMLLINIPTLLLTFSFVVIPQILFRWFQQVPPGYINATSFTGIELLTGTGFFTDTELYYGYYTAQNISIGSDAVYEMKYAYLFTCGGYYFLTLIILGKSIIESYRKYYIEASGSYGLFFLNKILGNWDYGITSEETVKLKHMSFYNEVLEYLSGQKKPVKEKKVEDVCEILWLRLFTNFLVLGMICGSGYLIFFLSGEQVGEGNTVGWNGLILPVTIGLIHLLIPFVFSFIESYERYDKPKYALYMHLVRSMLLRAGTLSVLVYYWYVQVPKSSKVECWETYFGQEIYRLVIIDFLFTLIGTFFSEFIRSLISKRVEKLKEAEFSIGRNTLDLIYAQALCWLGTFYAPLISFIVIIKLIIIFYVKKVSVMQNCKPSVTPWRAARSHTIFLAFLFIFFIVTTAAIACGIILIHPSKNCGPFKDGEFMYDVVSKIVDDWNERNLILGKIAGAVSSPGFIFAVMVLLAMGTYYMHIYMRAHKESVDSIKQQLVLEGKDKVFLLDLLKRASQKMEQFQPRIISVSPESSQEENFDHTGRRVFVRSKMEKRA